METILSISVDGITKKYNFELRYSSPRNIATLRWNQIENPFSIINEAATVTDMSAVWNGQDTVLNNFYGLSTNHYSKTLLIQGIYRDRGH